MSDHNRLTIHMTSIRTRDQDSAAPSLKKAHSTSDRLMFYASIFLIGWSLPGGLAILAGRFNLHYLMGIMLGCAALMVLSGCVVMWFWIKYFNIEMYHNRSPYPSICVNRGPIPKSWVPGHRYISAAKIKDLGSIPQRN